MAKIEYVGTPLRFNPETNLLEIRVEFIVPEMQDLLEEITIEKKQHKFCHKHFRKNDKSYEQQKFYYKFISEVLVKNGIEPTADNKQILDEEIRLELFPVKEIEYGSQKVMMPKRMREMSHREMARVLQRLTDRYSYLNIERIR